MKIKVQSIFYEISKITSKKITQDPNAIKSIEIFSHIFQKGNQKLTRLQFTKLYLGCKSAKRNMQMLQDCCKWLLSHYIPINWLLNVSGNKVSISIQHFFLCSIFTIAQFSIKIKFWKPTKNAENIKCSEHYEKHNKKCKISLEIAFLGEIN